MEHVLTSSGDLATLLAALCALVALNLLAKVGAFLWQLRAQRDDKTALDIEALTAALRINTASLDKLDARFQSIEREVVDMPKVKRDVWRLYQGLRVLSGERWPEVRKIMEED